RGSRRARPAGRHATPAARPAPAAERRRWRRGWPRYARRTRTRRPGRWCGCSSDDLEVACQFPVGHGAAELALLPLAAGGKVFDERLAEQFMRRLGVRQALGRLAQGARQLALGRELAVVGVAGDGLVRLDALLDAPQARAD